MPQSACNTHSGTEQKYSNALSAFLAAFGETAGLTRRDLHAAFGALRRQEASEPLSDEIRAVLGRYRV